jgi:hypothetical protein
MRHWIWRAALVAALTAASGARAAEITLSCGSQELEFRLCEEAAASFGGSQPNPGPARTRRIAADARALSWDPLLATAGDVRSETRCSGLQSAAAADAQCRSCSSSQCLRANPPP